MINYIKPKASYYDTIAEKVDLLGYNPSDENYIVIPQGYKGIFVSGTHVDSIKKPGTYDLADYTADTLYFYDVDPTTNSVICNLNRPMTGKSINGELITIGFTYVFTLLFADDSVDASFFDGVTLNHERASAKISKIIYDNKKEILSSLSYDADDYNYYDFMGELSDVVNEIVEREVGKYGIILHNGSCSNTRVNDPTFFNDSYDSPEVESMDTKSNDKEEPTKSKSSFGDDLFGTMFGDFTDSLKRGNSVEDATEEAENKMLGNFLSGLFGGK